MADLRKLDAVLPATSIEADRMSEVRGIVPGETLPFFEPPAGWLEPAVDPLHALVLAERAAGGRHRTALRLAGRAVAEFLRGLPAARRPWMLTDYAKRGAKRRVAVSTLTEVLRAHGHAALAERLAEAADAAADAPVFCGYNPFGRRPISLRTLAARRHELGMQEFAISVPMNAALNFCDDRDAAESLGQVWYETTRPRIEALSAEVGAELYYYRDPEDDCDDDYAHRYLVLDHICHMAPQSAYVAYLVEASGAASLADLRRAFFDPRSYAPGVDHGRYTEVEPRPWLARFDFDVGPERTTGVVVAGPGGLDLACGAIRTRLGQRVVVVLAGEGAWHADLVAACERARADWCVRADLDAAARAACVAGLDELWLFETHMPVPPKNLSVPDPLLLDYEARARAAGVPVRVFTPNGYQRFETRTP